METSLSQVTLKVFNPQGEINPPQDCSLSSRLSNLKGKTIALMSNGKHGTDFLHDAFEKLLKDRYPNINVLRTTKPGGSLLSSTDDWYTEVASKCDAFIFTIGD